jgi:hypothetical protein
MRLLASAVLLGGLVWGTFWGQDDHFPFGPFRMYSTTDEIDGDIRSLKFEGTTATGEAMEIPSAHFGLRRAEADGQVASVRADHSFLRHFVEAYETKNPDAPSLVKLRMYHGIDILEGRRPVGYREEDIAVWERP